MKPRTKNRFAKTHRFLSDTSGTATVEFVLWVPFLITLLILVAEVAFLFTVNSAMWNVTRDVTRRLAFHQIEPSQAYDQVMAQAFFQQSGYAVNVAESTEIVTVTVSLPIHEAMLMGTLADRIPGTLVAQISMLREPI